MSLRRIDAQGSFVNAGPGDGSLPTVRRLKLGGHRRRLDLVREPKRGYGHEVVATTDQELWAAAVVGDAGAFGVLFERHSRAVYNFAFRWMADWAAAEDTASEVFLIAWRRRGEVVFSSESGSVLPWLLGVATNHLRNQRRGARRADAAIARLDATSEAQPDFSDEIVGRMADQAQMAEVHAVVERLPEHERDVLALCAWAGLDYDEAAIALDAPVGTVRSRLSRARAHLRELVEGNGHEVSRDVVTR
jgi:RNA polymerase sigma factor (sigma-70 family)